MTTKAFINLQLTSLLKYTNPNLGIVFIELLGRWFFNKCMCVLTYVQCLFANLNKFLDFKIEEEGVS